jgi:hypothetical protein
MQKLSEQEIAKNVAQNPKQKWKFQNEQIQYLNDNRHESLYCNVTRFSPNGDLLAATDDMRISLLKFQKNF